MAGALGGTGMGMPSFSGLTTGGTSTSATPTTGTPSTSAPTLPGTTTPAAAAPTPAFTGAPATAASSAAPVPTNGANPAPLTPPATGAGIPDVPGTNMMGMPSWFQDMLNAKGGAWGQPNGTIPAPAPSAIASGLGKVGGAVVGGAAPAVKPAAAPAAPPPPLIGNQWDARYGTAPQVTGYTAAQMAAGKGPVQTWKESIANPGLAKQLADWSRWNSGEDAYGTAQRAREAEVARQQADNQMRLGTQR